MAHHATEALINGMAEQAEQNAETARKLLRAYSAKGWKVKSETPSDNPRIGTVYREVDELEELALYWEAR